MGKEEDEAWEASEEREWEGGDAPTPGERPGCLEVMATDEEMGVESEVDEWPMGEKNTWDSFFILLETSLSKGLNPSTAPDNQQPSK